MPICSFIHSFTEHQFLPRCALFCMSVKDTDMTKIQCTSFWRQKVSSGVDLSNYLAQWCSPNTSTSFGNLSSHLTPDLLSQKLSEAVQPAVNFKSFAWSWSMLGFENQQSSLYILPFLVRQLWEPDENHLSYNSGCCELWSPSFKDSSCPEPHFTIKQSKY